MTKCVKFNIYGIVQGVGFRFFTVREAHKIGVKGTVRNLSDGSVLAIIEGNEKQIDEFRNWLQLGPRFAHIDRILESPYEGEAIFKGFQIT